MGFCCVVALMTRTGKRLGAINFLLILCIAPTLIPSNKLIGVSFPYDKYLATFCAIFECPLALMVGP